MDFSSRITIESKLFPGVRYTLKRMSVARRAAFRQSIAGYSAKLREIWREKRPIEEEYRAASDAAEKSGKPIEFPDEKFERLMVLADRERSIDRDEMAPALIRTALASIEGLTIEGKPITTADELIAEAPPEVTDELAQMANWVAGLTPDQQGNLPWPGTSETSGAGPENPTSATTAEPTATLTDPAPST